MPTLGWEDRDAFLSLDEFGITATVTPQDGGPSRSIVGIFDDAFLNAQLGDYDLDTTQPRFLCKSEDAAGIIRADELTIEGETFDVRKSPRVDGAGFATIVMGRRHT